MFLSAKSLNITFSLLCAHKGGHFLDSQMHCPIRPGQDLTKISSIANEDLAVTLAGSCSAKRLIVSNLPETISAGEAHRVNMPVTDAYFNYVFGDGKILVSLPIILPLFFELFLIMVSFNVCFFFFC